MDTLLNILDVSWRVTGQMAPWLLLGFAFAGLLHVWVSPAWVRRHLGGRGLTPVLKSAVFGVPLPLCSCGVIPVTAGMVRQGAGRGAAASFLLATPQTGVDSIFATYALLGPVFALVRPVVALVTGIVGGTAIDLLAHAPPSSANAGTDDAACHTDTPRAPWWRRALRYSVLTLPGDIAPALVAGILVTGLITALIGPGKLEAYLGGGVGAMLIMIAVGAPIYVCSTGAIPLALSFLHLGASPGAALAFLIAGPATNAATVAIVWKLMDRRAAVIYLLTVILCAMTAGLLFDALHGSIAPELLAHMHHHEQPMSWLDQAGALLLTAVVLAGLAQRRRAMTAAAVIHRAGAQTLVLRVAGMNCSHCVTTVTDTLRAVPGVTAAAVELASGRATVEGDHLDAGALTAAVESVGYKATVQ